MNDIETALPAFYDLFLTVLNKHAPIKTRRVKYHTQPPWFNDEIKDARKKRDYYKMIGNDTLYKQWRNKTKKLIEQAKTDHVKDIIINKKDNKTIWQYLNSLQGKSSLGPNYPQTIEYHDFKTSDPTQITEFMNEYFTNITDSIKPPYKPIQQPHIIQNYINNQVPQNFPYDLPPISFPEVLKYLKNLQPKKATGLDNLGPKILKMSAEVIANSLTHIINLCLTNCIFPDQMKEAKIVPIFKKGSKEIISNYRPISILPTIS
ncbi:hypothetical protein SNE40_009773 [Patella caerulea]|uniref:Uncharacterized protein n=1 Tax=Patella caerulea TaxID=87958 RepID=A0AAN8JUR2_PATCE